MHQRTKGPEPRLIGFDLDDVLLEFFPVFAYRLLEAHGVDVRRAKRTDWEYVRLPEIVAAGLTESDVRRVVHQACHDHGAHADVGPIDPVMVQTVRRLRRDGHRVVLATARTPSSAAVVATWLDRHGLVFDELRFGRGSKLGLDILVEDSAHQVLRAVATGSQVFVPDRPWNDRPDVRGHPNVTVYDRPDALYPLMAARIQGVKDLYGFSSADLLMEDAPQADTPAGSP
ncbi:MAG: hypothetical protein KY455_05160 [Euryarchaeota archaeon]|nr:hypothetical protein [Euryarchaeota archaeon]